MSHWDNDTPHGMCAEACDEFLHLIQRYRPDLYHLATIRTWERGLGSFEPGIDLDQPFPYEWGDFRWHWVVQVGPWLIDWTARQFDPNNHFPVVLLVQDDQQEAQYA